jgi:hypothetical protein
VRRSKKKGSSKMYEMATLELWFSDLIDMH